MSEFMVRNWGNLASVAGLVFSVLAFVFAKRASTAAREARDAALRQSLGEEMHGASRSAQEIVTYLRDDKSEMALLRIGDLMNQASFILARWETGLYEKSRNNLCWMAPTELRFHARSANEERRAAPWRRHRRPVWQGLLSELVRCSMKNVEQRRRLRNERANNG